MTSLEHKLRKIEKILQIYPNASVRVRFHGSDNYCHFPSASVTNDTWSDTCDEGVVFEEFDDPENDTLATLERHTSFLECFKINDLENGSDTCATLGECGCRLDDLATAEPHTRTPLGVCMVAGDAPTPDCADLGEKDF